MTKRRFSKRDNAALVSAIDYLLQTAHRLASPDGIPDTLMESAVLEDALVFLDDSETVKNANKEMARLEGENDVVFVNNSALGSKSYLLVMQENVPGLVPYSLLPRRNGITSAPKRILEKLDFLDVSKSLSRYQGHQPLIVEKHTDSHRGEGVKVCTPFQFLRKAKNDGLHIYQTFCYPWERLSPDGHMRDCRVVMIGGEPAGYYVRKAKEPLIDASTGKLIEYPPSLTRVLTNVVQGGEVESGLDADIKERLYGVSKVVHDFMVAYTRLLNDQVGIHQPDVRYGFLAVDFLFYSTGKEVVAEVDYVPDLSACPWKESFAESYMKYMAELSQDRRRIFLRNGSLLEEKKTAADKLGIPYGIIR